MPSRKNSATELRVLSILLDFRREYFYKGLILYDFDDTGHTELMDLVQELESADIIRGANVEVYVGEEITKEIRSMDYLTNEFGEEGINMDELENDDHDAYMMLIEEDYCNERLTQLQGIDTEEWDRKNGTAITEELHHLMRWHEQFEKEPNVVGVNLDDTFGYEIGDPNRYGFRVLHVDQEKLKEFCKKKCPELLTNGRDEFSATLSYTKAGRFQVKVGNSVFEAKKALNDGQPLDVIFSYIFGVGEQHEKHFGEKIDHSYLMKNIFSSDKKIQKNCNELLDRTHFQGALAPFATINKDYFVIRRRVKLTLGQLDKIKNVFPLKQGK